MFELLLAAAVCDDGGKRGDLTGVALVSLADSKDRHTAERAESRFKSREPARQLTLTHRKGPSDRRMMRKSADRRLFPGSSPITRSETTESK